MLVALVHDRETISREHDRGMGRELTDRRRGKDIMVFALTLQSCNVGVFIVCVVDEVSELTIRILLDLNNIKLCHGFIPPYHELIALARAVSSSVIDVCTQFVPGMISPPFAIADVAL